MKKLFRDYSLSITLFVLFAVCWLLQTYAGYVKHVQGDATPYFYVWLQATMENWQSELLQLGLMVVLTAHLIHKGSPQSKEGSERLEAKIDELLRRTK
jgi:hypothetical protein